MCIFFKLIFSFNKESKFYSLYLYFAYFQLYQRHLCVQVIINSNDWVHITIMWTFHLKEQYVLIRLTTTTTTFKNLATRQFLQCSSLWNFFHPLWFAQILLPSTCIFLKRQPSTRERSEILLIISIISIFVYLSAPSIFQIFNKSGYFFIKCVSPKLGPTRQFSIFMLETFLNFRVCTKGRAIYVIFFVNYTINWIHKAHYCWFYFLYVILCI